MTRLCLYILLPLFYLSFSASGIASVDLSQFKQITNEQQLPKLLMSNLHRASFVQTKKLAALKRPIISSGELVVNKDLGLLWYTKKPLNSILKITKDGIYDIESNFNPIKQTVVTNNQSFNEFLFAVLNLNWQFIQHEFRIYQSIQEPKEFLLLPVNSEMSKVFSNFRMMVGDQIEQIILWENNSNKTTIEFTNLPTSALSKKELEYFVLDK